MGLSVEAYVSTVRGRAGEMARGDNILSQVSAGVRGRKGDSKRDVKTEKSR